MKYSRFLKRSIKKWSWFWLLTSYTTFRKMILRRRIW